MVGDPVALTIRRTIPRPPTALIDRFRDTPTGFVTDAMNGRGSAHHAIQPLAPSMRCVGPAVTAFCAPTDNLAAMACLDFVQRGDVIVIAAQADAFSAVIGDLWALWAKRLGVAGIVVDGLVRDVPGLLDADIPVFARGHCANAGYKNGPGEINGAVSFGGVPVAAGDIVVADGDGIVFVPHAQADALARVRRGETLGFWDAAGLAARGAVRWID
ncbi:MAG: RraA family protein [Burkholderiales bacterium]|nr:RraA family protein [Burkholderiales bacterium]